MALGRRQAQHPPRYLLHQRPPFVLGWHTSGRQASGHRDNHLRLIRPAQEVPQSRPVHLLRSHQLSHAMDLCHLPSVCPRSTAKHFHANRRSTPLRVEAFLLRLVVKHKLWMQHDCLQQRLLALHPRWAHLHLRVDDHHHLGHRPPWDVSHRPSLFLPSTPLLAFLNAPHPLPKPTFARLLLFYHSIF